MKKIIYITIVLISTLFININVLAKTTNNGVEIIDAGSKTYLELVCSYSAQDVIITYTGDHYEAMRYENGKELEGTLPFSYIPTKSDLKKYKFVNSDGSFECPKHLVVDYSTTSGKVVDTTNDDNDHRVGTGYSIVDLKASESSCSGACDGKIVDNSNYTCSYKGSSGTISVTGSGNKCTITYPDGTTKTETNGSCGNIGPTCPDIYYNTKTKDIKWASYDYSTYFNSEPSHYDPVQYEYICSDNENIEYFCNNGSCEFPNNKNINCDTIAKTIGGSISLCSEKGVKSAFRFLGYLLMIVKIIVPLLLIVTGMIEFGKAMVTGNQDAVKKAINSFVMKIIAGIIIFILPTVLNFIFGLISPYNKAKSDFTTCSKCLFSPGSCK